MPTIKAGAILLVSSSMLFAKSAILLHRLETQGRDARPTTTFTGQIMDSKCGTVGSHDPTMKNLGAKDAHECTLRCAKDGSFVLYSAENKMVYQLNDQEKPVRFAGQNVRISGSYEKASQTIVIVSIDAVNLESPKSVFAGDLSESTQ
jgi:hypothetical protein